MLVAFQPHLVSRTRHFGDAMGAALGAADEVVVCDVYLAREDPDPAVTGALVAAAVPLPAEQVAFVTDLGDVPAALVARARPGDLVLTLGAGGVTDVGPRVLALLAGDTGRIVRSLRRSPGGRDDGGTSGTPVGGPRRDRRQGHQRSRTLRAPAVATALAGVALPAGGRCSCCCWWAAGVWAVWFSSWLAVDTVDVSGAQTASADDIRARADIDVGEPLVRVDLADAEARVRSMAVVRTVEVTRQWPDGVLVSIEERVAIAVVDIGGRLRGMDAEGVVFRDYNRAPPGLPRVETSIGTTSEALREAALVISALPQELTLIVDHVQVETVDQISLVLKDGRIVIWGSSADSETKAEVLVELLKTPAQVYDVSVPSRPTTSP